MTNRDMKYLGRTRNIAGMEVDVFQKADGSRYDVTLYEQPEFIRRQAASVKAKGELYTELTETTKRRLQLKIAMAEEAELDHMIARQALGAPPKQRALPPRIIEDVDYREDDDE